MTAYRRPHPFVPTVLGALLAVPVHQLATALGASGREAFVAAVLAAMALGLTLGLVPRKPPAE